MMRPAPLASSFLASLLIASAAQAGSYISVTEDIPDKRTHMRNFEGAGGEIGPIKVCLDVGANEPLAIQAEPALKKVIATINRFRSLPDHTYALGAATDLPAGQYDFESVLLHEMLHLHGLGHTNHADEAGLPMPQFDGTKSADGANNLFEQNAGTDGLHGSADDVRGDDINLHWYQRGVNNVGIQPAIVDLTTMARALNFLPGAHLFAANGDRQVLAALGFVDAEAVMQQGTSADEVQRHLQHDDVTTLRLARSGLDGIQGTGDDYRSRLIYVGREIDPQTETCQMSMRFDNNTTFATSTVGSFRINTLNWGIYFSRMRFNPAVNWYLSPGANTVTTIESDLPDASALSQPFTVRVNIAKAVGNPIAGAPLGVVEVRDGERHDPGTAYCSFTLAGTPNETGECVLTPLRSGNRTLTAEYLGYGGFDGSSDTEAHITSGTLQFGAITHAPAPSAIGALVDFSWALAAPAGDPAAAATGSVVLKDAPDCASPPNDPAHQCTLELPAHACQLRFNSSGSKNMQLCYSGDGALATTSASFTHEVVVGRSTTSTIISNVPSTSVPFESVVIQVAVRETPDQGGHPPGRVEVRDGPAGDPLTAACTIDLAGTAGEIGQCTLAPPRVGMRTLTAQYLTQGIWAGSAGTAAQTVRSFTIARNQPSTSRVGQGVSVTIDLDVAPFLATPQPTGTVTISDGVDSCQIVLPASDCLWQGSTVGIRSLVASWPGDANYPAASTVPVSQNVVAPSYPQLVSEARGSYVDSDGASASVPLAFSADGRMLVFSSAATRLVNDDTNGVADIFVRDLKTGAVRRVSTSSQGVQANALSRNPAISANGRYVSFATAASNLVLGDTNGSEDAFVKDLVTGSIVRATTTASGAQTSSSPFTVALNTALSADGRYVAISTGSVLIPNAPAQQPIYVKDLLTGAVDLVSSTSSDEAGDFRSHQPFLSPDGRYVSFASQAFNLAPGDDNNMSDVFVKDRLTRKLTLVSTNAAGVIGNRYSAGTAPITADGRQIVFQSWANNLVGNDINNNDDIYHKDLLTGVPTPVSVTTTGVFPNRPAYSPSMSADARYVTFYTAANDLGAGDTNALDDVYLKDRQSGAVTRVSVGPTGALATGGASTIPSISPNGRFIAYQSSATNLVPGDVNGVSDVIVRDLVTNTNLRASAIDVGARSDGASNDAAISSDGRFVVYASVGSTILSGDTNTVSDVFLHDLSNATTLRASMSTAGIEGNAASDAATINADGTWIAFRSSASNLVAGDSNARSDVFIRERATGIVSRVSTSSAGAQTSSGQALGPVSISASGLLVVFRATDTDLVTGDSNAQEDVFVKDRQSGSVAVVSSDATGVFGNGPSTQAVISQDGSRVAFASDASNLVVGDSNGVRDVFVKNLGDNIVLRVSSSAAGVAGDAVSSAPSISADGRFVAFVSAASNLVAGDSNGQADVFVKDLSNASIERVDTNAAGAQGSGGDCVSASISVDGRYIGFVCGHDNLVAGDSNGLADAFVKDRQTGTIRRLSISAVGAGANAASSSGTQALSNTGFMVFSSAANNLVVADNQQYSDVFLHLFTAAPLLATTTAIGTHTPEPSPPNQPYTVTVSVSRQSGVPPISGNVTVSDGSAFCVAVLTGSGATATGQCALTSTSIGLKTLTAVYAGDASYAGSTAATVTHLVFVPTVPGAPIIGTATAGSGSAIVDFAPPGNDGGSVLTGYAATCGAVTVVGSAAPITVAPLVNGVAVSCRVVARNAVGDSLPSAESNLITPRASVTMQIASSTNPATAFTSIGYTATLVPATASGSIGFSADLIAIPGCESVPIVAGSSVCTTSFSTLGTRAIQASYAGDSAHAPASTTLAGGQQVVAPSIAIAPELGMGGVGIAYGPVQMLASGGTGPYTFSAVGALPDGLTLDGGGVLSGTPTTREIRSFAIVAHDTHGFEGTRGYSIAIATTPEAPLLISAIPLSTVARLAFIAPGDNGGSAIIDYTATCTPGPHVVVGLASPIDVPGLSDNVAYQCRVQARNVIGLGASSAQASVIPGSGGSSADLGITKSNGTGFVNGGAPIDYLITVSNPGPAAVVGARIEDTLGSDFIGAIWNCEPQNGAFCPSAGSGSLDILVDLPVQSSVQILFRAIPAPGSETPLSNVASVLPPATISDPQTANNVASDGPDIRGVFRDGFE